MKNFRLKYITIILSFIFTLLMVGCNDEGGESSHPELGKVYLERTGNTSIKVTWQTATDSLTLPEEMGYEVYLSQVENFTPDASTLYTTVFGVTETEIFNLQVDQTYYVLVIAVNRAGQQSRERDYQAIILNDTPPPTQQVIQVTDLQTDLGLMVFNLESSEFIAMYGTKSQDGYLTSVSDVFHAAPSKTYPEGSDIFHYHFENDDNANRVEITSYQEDGIEDEDNSSTVPEKTKKIVIEQAKPAPKPSPTDKTQKDKPKVKASGIEQNNNTGQENVTAEVSDIPESEDDFVMDPHGDCFKDPNCDLGERVSVCLHHKFLGILHWLKGRLLGLGNTADDFGFINQYITPLLTKAFKTAGLGAENLKTEFSPDMTGIDQLYRITRNATAIQNTLRCGRFRSVWNTACRNAFHAHRKNAEEAVKAVQELIESNKPSEPVDTENPNRGWCAPKGPKSGVRGDPHLYTFDRLSFDFQAVGEFTFVKSTIPNDSFEVQARLAPVGNRTDVSVVQAVAVNVEGDRVGFYRGQDPVAYINGTPTPLTNEVIYLPNGGRVGIDGSTYKVGWPGGTVVGLRGTTLTVYLKEKQQNKVVGILGNADGISQNDIFTRLGNNLGTNPDFYTFYNEYANSWRISQNESLFDYAQGETTETFTIEDYPRTLVRASDLDATTHAAAAQICRDAGITDPVFLEDCILDVALTGDPTFAENPGGLTPALSANVIPPLPPQAGTTGFSQLSGLVYDVVAKKPINNAQVTLTTNGLPLVGVNAKFTNDGKYQTDVVPTGSGYQLDITSTDYIAEKVFNLTTLDAQTKTVELVNLVPLNYQGQTAAIKGTVKGATDNQPISGLNVNVRRHINNRIGEAIQATQTDSSGKFRLNNVQSGNYTVELQGEGFATNYVTAISMGNETTEIEAFMSPALKDALYRIVLTWGDFNNDSVDLDAHLTGPDGQGKRFHLYFNKPGSGSIEEPPYAWLDRDDNTGAGPESITIFKLQPGGIYRYSVHNYAHSAMTHSETLRNSAARVDIYSQRGFESRFNVPQQEGTMWTVFEIDQSGSIYPVNSMGYEVNQGGLPWWNLSTGRPNPQHTRPITTDYNSIIFQGIKQ